MTESWSEVPGQLNRIELRVSLGAIGSSGAHIILNFELASGGASEAEWASHYVKGSYSAGNCSLGVQSSIDNSCWNKHLLRNFPNRDLLQVLS